MLLCFEKKFKEISKILLTILKFFKKNLKVLENFNKILKINKNLNFPLLSRLTVG